MSTKFDDELIKQLEESFPDDALQKNTISGFQQIGIKPAYITQRLNKVFGHKGWRDIIISSEIQGDFAEALVRLEVLDENGKVIAERTQYGGSRIVRGNIPDARKGASTNALCKCAAFLDIGLDAYKGELEWGDDDSPAQSKVTTTPKTTGYQPTKKLDTPPPQGGSGVPPKQQATVIDRSGLDTKIKRLQLTLKLDDASLLEKAKEITEIKNLSSIKLLSAAALEKVANELEKLVQKN